VPEFEPQLTQSDACRDPAALQAEHERLQGLDDQHDRSSCWCCCITCDGDYAEPCSEDENDENHGDKES